MREALNQVPIGERAAVIDRAIESSQPAPPDPLEELRRAAARDQALAQAR